VVGVTMEGSEDAPSEKDCRGKVIALTPTEREKLRAQATGLLHSIDRVLMFTETVIEKILRWVESLPYKEDCPFCRGDLRAGQGLPTLAPVLLCGAKNPETTSRSKIFKVGRS